MANSAGDVKAQGKKCQPINGIERGWLSLHRVPSLAIGIALAATLFAGPLFPAANASPHGHPPSPPPPPPVYHPPPTPPQPPVQPPVRPPSQIQDRIIQQQILKGAARTKAPSAFALPPLSKGVAGKVNSWEDIGKLSEAELAALFKEWGLLPNETGKITGSQIKSMWLNQARAQGVPKAQIDAMLGNSGGSWAQMANQINNVVSGVGDPNVAMGSLFKQEYAKTCQCSPKAFADALGRAETKLGGQMQSAMAKAIGGLGFPVGALPSAPVVTYSTNDQAVLVAQAIIDQGQNQSFAAAPPRPPATPPVAPPATPPVAPPATPPVAPPATPPVAPPATPPVAPPATPPVAPPATPPVAPPATPPVAPPATPPVAPPATPPGTPPDTGLLDLSLPPMPDLDPGMPDIDVDSVGPTEPVVLTDLEPQPLPKVPPPPPCKTPECFQKQLDALAIERKVIDQKVRSQPMIQSLDTIGGIFIGVSPFTGPAAPAMVVVGSTLVGLKVLVTAGTEAKITRLQGGSQGDATVTFFTTTATEGGTQVIKEVASAGLGKFIPVDASTVVDASGNVLISVAVDNAATIGSGVVDVATGNGEKVVKDVKVFAGDTTRAMTGGGF